MVTASNAERVFTDPSCWPVLRRIIVHSIDDNRTLVLICRNVRSLVLTDPDIRDFLFNTVYGLPFRPRSLDGVPDRAPHDTEMYLREQALLRLLPSVVRCVHSDAAVAVRDGYMLTMQGPRTANGKSIATGWSVWYLPQWYDVRKTYDTNRDPKKSARADPLAVREVPMSQRPAGAINNQNLWRWEYDFKAFIPAIAMQPEDNLVAVAALPETMRYSLSADKKPTYLGRRYRVYFFQMRPLGLASCDEGLSDKTPIPHPQAVRPYIDFIEPLSNVQAAKHHFRLKAGPNGHLAMLLLSKDGEERSGPLSVWNWRRGECVGYFPPREGKSNILDFDFYTTRSVVILEAYVPPATVSPSGSSATTNAPLKTRLSALRFGSAFPANNNVHYAEAKGSSVKVADNTWLMSELRQEKVSHIVSVEMPPSLDRTLRVPLEKPVSAIYGRLSMYPPMSDDYTLGSISYTLWSKPARGAQSTTPVVRGAIPAAILASQISRTTKMGAIRSAIATWLKQADLPTVPYPFELIQSKFSDALSLLATKDTEEDNWIWEEHYFANDFYLSYGVELFEALVIAADEMASIAKRGTGATPTSIGELLDDCGGLERHSEIFAQSLPALVGPMSEATMKPFSEWCEYADFFVTPPSPQADVYAARLVYLDYDNEGLSGKKMRKDGLPAELTDKRCWLVVRNYNLSMIGFPRAHTMDAAQRLWCPGSLDDWEDCPLEALDELPEIKRPARYVKCGAGSSGTRSQNLHAPWLGTQVLGCAFWKEHDLPVSAGCGAATSNAAYTELRVGVVSNRDAIAGVFFDGQSMVIAQADKNLIISF